jgi:hypothetical protein
VSYASFFTGQKVLRPLESSVASSTDCSRHRLDGGWVGHIAGLDTQARRSGPERPVVQSVVKQGISNLGLSICVRK